jgi:uncharacterized membrane protein YkvA (DUF1232 family)
MSGRRNDDAAKEEPEMTPLSFTDRLKNPAWKSMFFDRLKGRAAKLAFDRPRLWGRVGRAARLAREHKTAFGGDYGHLRALFRMLRAWTRGAYRPATWTIVSAAAVILYLLSPIDLIPDFLPAVGLLDDASFFVWVLARIRGELDRFVAWEQPGTDEVPAIPLLTP